MIVVERSVRLDAPPDRVFRYITDLGSFPEWQVTAGITRARTVDGGPLAKGSDFRMERSSRGRTATIHCSVIGFEPDRRFSFTTKDDDGFTGDVDTRLTPDGDGTRLDWTLRMRPPGAWRLLSPVIKREIAKAADADFATLRSRLATQAPA
ncbi:MAG: SRPBCC family protein [Chloroflexota bacterium]|nr:SRPBCC family protein [Chloroflexota bacterium]